MTREQLDNRPDRLGISIGTEIRGYKFSVPPNEGSTGLLLLGTGGSSVVYRVFQVLDATRAIYIPRAMKLFVMREDLHSEDTSFLPAEENFLEEIKNVSQLAHENLIQVTDAGAQDLTLSNGKIKRIPVMITHLITGCTLRDVIEKSPNGLSTRQRLVDQPDLAIEVLIQMARGLGYLHSKKFLHCDIAPKNVFLEEGQQLRVIVGDVGMSRYMGANAKEKVFVAGTKSYAPSGVLGLFGQNVSIKSLKEWFPSWDIYGFAKTGVALLTSILEDVDKPWLRAAKSKLVAAESDFKRFETIDELAEQIEYCRPIHRERGGVPELEPSVIATRKRMMPIEALSLTKRIDELVRHPALTRLQGVPQLTIVGSSAPGGSHTRYEHSLGVMENVRRMLSMLLDEPTFLEVLQKASIETGLITALLYNATRFPLSNIVHELNKRIPPGEPKKMFHSFGRAELFNDILGDQFKSHAGLTLEDQIRRDFTSVDINVLRRILTANAPSDLASPVEVILYTLLNSSLDARVIDFVRRDSLHLGISSGDFFSLDDLLPHLRITPNQSTDPSLKARISLKSTGVSVAEQIILMRYWLFSRVYWNQPTRAYNAAVRRVLLDIRGIESFESELRRIALHTDERSMAAFLGKFAREHLPGSTAALLRLIAGHEKVLYKLIFERSLRNCDTDHLRQDRSQMERLVSPMLSYEALRSFEIDISDWLEKALNLPADTGPPLVLIDIPFEPGSNKLGTDIFVMVPRRSQSETDDLRTLDQISPVIDGVNRNFVNDLQRLRIFIRPDLKLPQDRDWGLAIYDRLTSLVGN